MTRPAALRILQPHVRFGDPHVTTDDPSRLSLLHALYEPLVRRTGAGTYGPCLADRWHLADDACRWTFRLREDARFHDGRPFTAADAVATLARVRDGNVGGELGTAGVIQSYLAGATVSADGAHTLTLTTPDPMADLLDLLVDLPIVSAHGLAQQPPAFVGTGPYQVAERADGVVRLARYGAHWQGGGVPEALVWIAEPDAHQRLAALTAGNADVAADLPVSAAVADGVRLIRVQTTVCATFMCNLFEGACTHRAVRQALNYGIDVPDLIDTVAGGAAVPLTGPLTARHQGFDPATPAYGYDPARARALLAEAGYGPRLSVTLDVPTTLPDEAVALARRMGEHYSGAGIDVQVVPYTDRPAYAERVRAKQIHDAACFDSSPPSTFRVLREKFHSGLRGPWWLGYQNPAVDRLIDTARATVAAAARQQHYRHAYRLLHDDAPWIFLYNPYRVLGAGPALGTWQPSTEGYLMFTP